MLNSSDCSRAFQSSNADPCTTLTPASAALKVRMDKTDQSDAEGLAQTMRTGWHRPMHVKPLDAHRARALLGAKAQLVGMTTRLSNHIRDAQGVRGV